MEFRLLLPDRLALQCNDLKFTAGLIIIAVSSTVPTATCPRCSQPSSRIHSRYTRHLADLPWHGIQVQLQWQSRKFFCGTPSCPQRIFTERLPTVAAVHARKTVRMMTALRLVGFSCGGEVGSRLADRLQMPASPATLLRMIRRTQLPPPPTPEVLGVDDWALRRGQRYGTILCDLKRHRPVELLPERSSEVLRDWLLAHPGVKVISRDRGDNYIKGATAGAPQAIQVADRWHLLHNLRETLARLADRYPRQIESATITAAQSQEPHPEPSKPPDPIPESPPQKPPRAEELQQLHRQRRRERYQRVLELYAQHLPLREIARRMSMNRSTVRKFMRADSFPERAHRYYPRGTDPFLEYLQTRWQEGCHNAIQLTQELQNRGFQGSYHMVRRRVASWRDRPRSRTRSCSRAVALRPKIERPSSTRVSWLLLKPLVDLEPDEQALVEALAKHCPVLLVARDLAQEFATIVRDRKAELLEDWKLRASSSESPLELQSFARGLDDDWAAVEAALTLPWSNGQTEGQINRLKMVKRQMFGRAKMDLLRQRFLQPV